MKFSELPNNLGKYGFCKKVTPSIDGLDEQRVLEIADWIRPRWEKQITINKEHGYSYMLKHIVEEETGQYVGNGELTAAMLLLGFEYKEEMPHAGFNVSAKSIKKSSRRFGYNENWRET